MLFSKKTASVEKSTLEVLQERSGNAVKVITDTIEDLKSTNEEINKEQGVIATKIAKLNEESATLVDLSAKNSRIVSNFEELLK